MARRRQTPSADLGCVNSSPDVGDEATHLVDVLGVSRAVAISGRPRGRISSIARLQRGRISRQQLLAVGIADRTIYNLAAAGFLVRKCRGVFAVGHDAPAPLALETEALLACGPHAALSHNTAARIWELLPEGDSSVHMTVRVRHATQPPGVQVHRTTRLSRGEVRVVEDLPVTSVLRTLLDLAEVVDAETLERAIEEAIIQKRTSERQLRQAVKRASGRKGAGNVRAVLDAGREPGVTRSRAERRFRALIRAAQLPEPRTNVRIHGVEPDAYWPDLGVVVEVQSQKFHLTRAALERDTRKAARLTAAGLIVSYVTWLQMEHEPFAVVARVAQTLARAELGRGELRRAELGRGG